MSKRSKEWAKKSRLALIAELGGKCANPECGESDYEKLTIDHIYGKDWETTGLSTDQRMCRYRKEHKLGLLQCLCLLCNSRRGDPQQAKLKEKIRILFKLNGQCANRCENVYIGDLEFVHVDQEWTPADVHGDDKVALYAREIEQGRCTILCPECRGDATDRVVVDSDMHSCALPDPHDPF